jgi:hypothetical protein
MELFVATISEESKPVTGDEKITFMVNEPLTGDDTELLRVAVSRRTLMLILSPVFKVYWLVSN